MNVPCPDCAAPLPPSPTACPTCHLPLTGPQATRLWQIDQSMLALRAERIDLLTAMRAGAPGPAPTSGLGRAPWSPQRLLLGAGVVLLLVAAVVFVGIAWTRIGVAGQVALLLTATGGAVTVSRTFARRGLLTSSEAVAALALGLAALDLDAAHRLGLYGLDAVDSDRYAVAALTLLTLLAAGSARLVPSALAYPLGATLAAALVPFATLSVVDGGPTAVAVTGAIATLVGVATAVAARAARRPVLGAVLLVTAGWAIVGVRAALADAYDHPLDDGGLGAVLSLVAVAAAMAVLARTSAAPRVARRAARLAVAAVTVGAGVAVAHHGGPLALITVSVVAAALAGSLRRRPGLPALGAYVLAWAAGLAAELEPSTRSPAQRSLWLAALAAAAASAATATTGRRRRLATALAGLTGVLAISAGVAGQPLVVQIAALLLVTTGLTLAAAWRLREPEEPALGGAAVLAGVAALSFDGAGIDSATPAAVVLAACGVLALGYASLPRRGHLSIVGVLLCSAATWVLSADASVDTIEVYTLPLAALALAVGAVRQRRYPSAPSWTTVGPGLSAALLPSAVATMTDDGLTRPLLVLLAAVLTTLAGAALRWQAPVLTGSVAALLVAFSQLAPYAAHAPRWLSLALGGTVLLALGTRYEQRRRDAREAARWVSGLR